MPAVDGDGRSTGRPPCADDIATLYRGHARSLVAFLVRRGIDRPLAEDAVQETFAVVATQRDNSLNRGYLATIAWRTAMRSTTRCRETATAAETLEGLVGQDDHGDPEVRLGADVLLGHLSRHNAPGDVRVAVQLARGWRPGAIGLSSRRLQGIRDRLRNSLTGTPWDNARSCAHAVPGELSHPVSQLVEEIGRLPFRQREVLTRSAYLRIPPRTIARSLGITANDARVCLFAARTTLARRLGVARPRVDEMLQQITSDENKRKHGQVVGEALS